MFLDPKQVTLFLHIISFTRQKAEKIQILATNVHRWLYEIAHVFSYIICSMINYKLKKKKKQSYRYCFSFKVLISQSYLKNVKSDGKTVANTLLVMVTFCITAVNLTIVPFVQGCLLTTTSRKHYEDLLATKAEMLWACDQIRRAFKIHTSKNKTRKENERGTKKVLITSESGLRRSLCQHMQALARDSHRLSQLVEHT